MEATSSKSNSTADMQSLAVPPQTAPQPGGEIKKTRRRKHIKTSRACNHCHKAHMTCDDSRPCKRCVQRNLGDTCVDAPRKKKKYLMDLEQQQQQQQWGGVSLTQDMSHLSNDLSNSSPSVSGTPNEAMNVPPVVAQSSSLDAGTQNNGKPGNSNYPSPLAHFQYDNGFPKDFNDTTAFSLPSINNFRKTPFASSAANLEYSVLGNIVNDPYSPSLSPSNYAAHEEQAGSLSRPIVSYPNLPNSDNNGQKLTQKHTQHQHQQQQQIYPKNDRSPYSIPTLPPQPKPQYEKRRSTQTSISPSDGGQSSLYSDSPRYDTAINQYYIGPVHGVNEEVSLSISFPNITKAIKENEQNNPKSFFNNKGALISFSVGLTSEDEYNRKVVDAGNIYARHGGLKYKEPSEIYSKIQKPFSYYPGYHQLLNYLNSRFNKTQIVSMAKTMAEYRPSFIAATCNLKEDDLIFMEQCFQRTLLEYDNYISISGTPTIVWRRTGQVAYVGNEFSILTGWSKEALLDRVSLIVELLEDESVLEYFKLFNKIAFGDFRGASMSECTLLSPQGQKIRCRCLMTLKRDVFGIPMMIIGNFLPILSEYGEVED